MLWFLWRATGQVVPLRDHYHCFLRLREESPTGPQDIARRWWAWEQVVLESNHHHPPRRLLAEGLWTVPAPLRASVSLLTITAQMVYSVS